MVQINVAVVVVVVFVLIHLQRLQYIVFLLTCWKEKMLDEVKRELFFLQSSILWSVMETDRL